MSFTLAVTEVVRHLESVYPQEGCGVLLWNPQANSWRVHPITNAYDRYHAADPVSFLMSRYVANPLIGNAASSRPL